MTSDKKNHFLGSKDSHKNPTWPILIIKSMAELHHADKDVEGRFIEIRFLHGFRGDSIIIGTK